MSLPAVLQVLPAFDSGGVERATLDMATYLAKQTNLPVSFIASSGGQLVSIAEEVGVNHILFPLQSKNPWTIFRNSFRLASFIRSNKIQLVHVRSRAPGWSVFLASKMTKVPFITTYHGIYSRKSFLKWLYNSVMIRGKTVIAISQHIEKHIKKEYAGALSKIKLVYEGIDTKVFSPDRIYSKDIAALREFWGVKSNQKIILLPGRLSKGKGHLVAIEALKLLSNQQYVLVFLGASQGKEDFKRGLEQQIQSRHLEDQVKFIDSCLDMPLAYAACHIALSIGTTPEAFGRVAVEAGSMEKIVIGVKSGATPELCQDGKTGFLIPPQNPCALSEAIEKILCLSSEEYQKIGKTARSFVMQHFDAQRMFEETLLVYTLNSK